MLALIRDKKFSVVWFRNWTAIFLGSAVMAAGYVFFIIPHKIVPGGVFGISIIFHHEFGFPTGLTGFVLNLPLVVWGVRELGPRFGLKTIVGQALTAANIDVLSWLWGPAPLTEDILVSSLFGGLLIGAGLAFIFKAKATTGGSDIVAAIIFKRTRSPVGRNLIIIDAFVVLAGILAFRDPNLALYALVTIFVSGRAIDGVLEGSNCRKAVFIISSKTEEVRRAILAGLGRGGTLLQGTGLFQGAGRPVIMTAVSRRELAILEEQVRSIDVHAFVIVFDAREILGEGFRPLSDSSAP